MNNTDALFLNTPDGTLNLKTLEMSSTSKVQVNSMTTSSRYLFGEDYIEPKEFIKPIDNIASTLTDTKLRSDIRELQKQLNFDKVLLPFISVLLGKDNHNPVYFTISDEDNLIRIVLDTIIKTLGSLAAHIKKREICKLKGKTHTGKDTLIAGRNKKLLFCSLDEGDTIHGEVIETLKSRFIETTDGDKLEFNANLIIISNTNNKVFTKEGEISLEVLPGKVFSNMQDDNFHIDYKLFEDTYYKDRIFTYIIKILKESCIDKDVVLTDSIQFNPVKLFWDNAIDIISQYSVTNNHPIITVDTLYRKHFLSFIDAIGYIRNITKDEFSKETSNVILSKLGITYYRSTKTEPAGYSGIRL